MINKYDFGNSTILTREILCTPPGVYIGQLEHLPQLLNGEGSLQRTSSANQMDSFHLAARKRFQGVLSCVRSL